MKHTSHNILTTRNTRIKTLARHHLEYFSHLILALQLLTLNRYFLPGTFRKSQTKPLKIKTFLPFNFAITKICIVTCLAEDGTRIGRMGGGI